MWLKSRKIAFWKMQLCNANEWQCLFLGHATNWYLLQYLTAIKRNIPTNLLIETQSKSSSLCIAEFYRQTNYNILSSFFTLTRRKLAYGNNGWRFIPASGFSLSLPLDNVQFVSISYIYTLLPDLRIIITESVNYCENYFRNYNKLEREKDFLLLNNNIWRKSIFLSGKNFIP